jgi:hypothetical protein
MQIIEASQMRNDLTQKGLDPETIARMGREWDKGINEKRVFSIHAKVSPTPEGGETDKIFVMDNNVNTGRPIRSTLKVIEASQIDDDLEPRKTSE